MKVSKLISYAFSKHSRYLVLGGGTGGVSISSHLLRSGVHHSEIRVVDPSPVHYYQPGWTMVGAGQWMIQSTVKPIEEVLPSSVSLARERVKLIKPNQNKVTCESGAEFTYDELIVATGMQLQYWKVQGLKQALDDPDSNVASIYELSYAEKMAKLGEKLKSGKAIFTEPAMPIKCPGAPQKLLYLWSDRWSKEKLPIEVQFYKTVAVMFSVPKYAQALTKVAAGFNIKTNFKHPLIKVKGNEATFENLQTKQKITKKFDLLHTLPPMGAHAYIAESGLGDAAGFLDCNKYTMRHNKYNNIWGLGDCTSLPCSKTAAAAFAQNEALYKNLMTIRKNPTTTTLPYSYQGYASCPLFVGHLKLILAQFKYDGVIDETFYNDQENPRYEFYFLKRFGFPLAYWWLMPKGLWRGRKGLRWA